MMRLLLFLLMASSASFLFGQQAPKASIIPEPVSVNYQSGEYVLGSATTVYVGSEDKDAIRVGQWLADALSRPTGLSISLKTGPAMTTSTGNILLSLNAKADAALGKEGYTLSAGNAGVVIKANTVAGLFYGTQTLLQLFPPSIESKTAVKDIHWAAPAVEITDYPRFGWRGLMFDVSRHFFTKQEVKEFIDDMVRYKYNLLHFHLTDDEGWRIEIKSLPKLTQVGAWNVKKTGTFGTFSQPAADEPRNNGGFYTQEDIKELIQ
jgi:hexosaminidase